MEENGTVKTLGLHLNPKRDSLQYSAKFTSRADTMHGILSKIVRLSYAFGPTGPAKILIQELWKLKCGWDEPVPTNNRNAWEKIAIHLTHVWKFRMFRCIVAGLHCLQLHYFGDARQSACEAFI